MEDISLERWKQIQIELRLLNDELYQVKNKLEKEFLGQHSEVFVLPKDVTLNWRPPVVHIRTDYKNLENVIVEIGEVESPRLLNGRNSKAHKAGEQYIVLKSWKTGSTKGTHYLLYDNRKNKVANFYG